MSSKLRVLYLEDNTDDFLLVQRELQKAGWALEMRQVDNEHDFTRHVREGNWDIVLADFNLPGYGGMAALEFVRRTGYEAPFILITRPCLMLRRKFPPRKMAVSVPTIKRSLSSSTRMQSGQMVK